MTFTQKTTTFHAIILLFGLAIGYSFALVNSENHQISNFAEKIESRTVTMTGDGLFDSDKIKRAIAIIKKYSYGFDKKSSIDIEDAVLKSIADGLGDKHSTYFTPKETKQFEEALRGDFEGIGAVINEHPQGIKIMKIIPGAPAEKAGLKAGDILIRVGDKSLLGETTENAVTAIRGPKGSQIKITYKRGDSDTESQVDVTRDVVNLPSVNEKLLENNIGYIEISTFGEHTTGEFVEAWNRLSKSGAMSMILDFRNNGGGYLETAVDLASIVLPENAPVVMIKENDPRKNETLYTRSGARNNLKIPIIVLINDYSASASEIFAGALKDHNRAIILGQKSYGKGSVQEPFDLGDGSIIKITTARWYTPKDISIDEKGITPDIQVLLTQKDYETVFDRQLQAAQNILTNETGSGYVIDNIKAKYKTETFESLTK